MFSFVRIYLYYANFLTLNMRNCFQDFAQETINWEIRTFCYVDDKNSVFAYLKVLSNLRSVVFIYGIESSVFCAFKFFLP